MSLNYTISTNDRQRQKKKIMNGARRLEATHHLMQLNQNKLINTRHCFHTRKGLVSWGGGGGVKYLSRIYFFQLLARKSNGFARILPDVFAPKWLFEKF